MKFLLKAEEGEQVKNATPWELTFYDDIVGNIYTITEFAYSEDSVQ